YRYLTQNYRYWSKRGIKGPRPLPIFGNILDIFITPRPIQELNWAKKFGKLYGYYFKAQPILTISDPDLIKTILVKDFHLFTDRSDIVASSDSIVSKNLVQLTGDDWKRVRSIVSPTFTSGKMKKMYPRIRECLTDFMNHLEGFAVNRGEINVKDMYGNYTMDVIATCAFATKTGAHNTLDSPFVVMARSVFNVHPLIQILTIFFPKLLLKLKNIITPKQKNEGNFFIDNTRRIIQERRQNNEKYNDFLQLLMDVERDRDNSRDENDINESHHVNEGEEELAAERKALNISLDNKRLTEDEILAQALVFFLAGFETTATTLTFCTYELALNPHIQETLLEEVNSSVDSNGEISYEELARLPYLDAVLSETLRLHPPALRLHRMASTDYKLGTTGLTLFKGQTVQIAVYGIHTTEEYHPNPFKFNPDRFMPENRHNIIPYTYLPFGAGQTLIWFNQTH
ncbi:unnamed protein product, partial [Oppiella nova]